MPTFHRNSANPAGYAAFPSGYDFINNPSANSLPGDPAPFDAIKSGGPNAGSYYFAFGDDILAEFINRPVNALADNCDTLDNYLRKPIAIPTVTGVFIAGVGGDASRVLPTSPAVYLGTAGQDTIVENTGTLFYITDNFGQPLINETNGEPIEVVSITSTSGGDAIGVGFAAGTITLNFDFAIPVGTDYQIYYGVKGNLAFMPPDALLFIQNGELPWSLTDFVLQVSEPGNLPADVTALVATHFRTPNGQRLPQSATMNFDVDPHASGATLRSFKWTSLISAVGARTVAQLFDDPDSALLAAATGALRVDAGIAFDSLGTTIFHDANIGTGPGGNVFGIIPLSSTTTQNGDQFIRIGDAFPTSVVPNTYPESILQSLNARSYISVGDGIDTFGDFNGAGALEAAVNFFVASGEAAGHIKVKSGSYTWASGHNLAGSKALYIEGAGSASTFVTSSSPGTPLIIHYNFFMQGISWVQSPGTSVTGFFAAGGCTFLNDVVLQGLIFQSSNAINLFTPTAVGPAFQAKNCLFVSTNPGNPSIVLELDDGNAHDGYLFEDCTFNAAVPEAKVVTIVNNVATAGTVMSNLRFTRCTYVLAGTLVTTGVHANNTGVLEISPNAGSTQNLTIQDTTFQDCDVSVVGGALGGYASILAYIMPLPKGATTTTTSIVLQKVTIRGGHWDAGGAPSELAPLLICAQKIIVDDVDFYGTAAPCAGAAPVEASYAVNGSATPIPTATWGNFTFSVGGSAQINVGGSSVFPTDMGVDMTNVRFSRLQQFGACDVRVDLPGTYTGENVYTGSRIQNVKLFNYQAATAAGTAPKHRFYLNSLFTTTGSNTVRTVVDQVILHGVTGGESAGWTNSISAGGLVGIEPTIDLTLKNVTVNGFAPASGNPDNGFYINYGHGLDQYQIQLVDCRASGCSIGLFVPNGSGSNNPLDGFKIIRGDYSNGGIGISLEPDALGDVVIDKVRATYNTDPGIIISPRGWTRAPASGGSGPYLAFTDNILVGNNPSASPLFAQAEIFTANSGDFIYGTIRGNLCRHSSGGQAAIRITEGVAAVITSPGTLGVNTFVRDAETGWGSSPALTYANGTPMLHNDALLMTP